MSTAATAYSAHFVLASGELTPSIVATRPEIGL